jgi:hypothetical protein
MWRHCNTRLPSCQSKLHHLRVLNGGGMEKSIKIALELLDIVLLAEYYKVK